MDGTITHSDGRVTGFADYGEPGQKAVLWCLGGPGSRLEPKAGAEAACAAEPLGHFSIIDKVFPAILDRPAR